MTFFLNLLNSINMFVNIGETRIDGQYAGDTCPIIVLD